MNRPIQFGCLVLESSQESAAFLNASIINIIIIIIIGRSVTRSVYLVVVKDSVHMMLLIAVAVLIDFRKITLAATDQVDDRRALQLWLFVAEMRIRFVHH